MPSGPFLPAHTRVEGVGDKVRTSAGSWLKTVARRLASASIDRRTPFGVPTAPVRRRPQIIPSVPVPSGLPYADPRGGPFGLPQQGAAGAGHRGQTGRGARRSRPRRRR